jgi:hypothetical protein
MKLHCGRVEKGIEDLELAGIFHSVASALFLGPGYQQVYSGLPDPNFWNDSFLLAAAQVRLISSLPNSISKISRPSEPSLAMIQFLIGLVLAVTGGHGSLEEIDTFSVSDLVRKSCAIIQMVSAEW